ncbi:MAG: hypothetical protein GX366_02590 [Epulopiscium sp.]|nr:hypothetical protein [Candidatus Epulonipiscium sp.]
MKKRLVYMITMLIATTLIVGCSKKADANKLKGEMISQGVFPILETFDEDSPDYIPHADTFTYNYHANFGPGTTLEFLNNKEMIFGPVKVEYEFISDDKISLIMSPGTPELVHKYEYNDGIFRLYGKEGTCYIDYIKEGTDYTPESIRYDEM